ncbi:MAG: cysteine desulfurase [Acidimicrobiaceae bacterium]|nr:cysteine desulfurase [Acidimicrobiaceae bacterium]
MSDIEASNLIYLDHNSTTPVADEVLDAMLPYLKDFYGNPSSEHALGYRSRQAIENARANVASLIGSEPKEIVFTSGGTESNNLAIRGTAMSASPSRRRIVTSIVEHPATAAPCALLESEGWTVTRLGVSAAGIVDREALIGALGEDVALLTLMLAQNEIGSIMPVEVATRKARQLGVLTHTDAAQAIGKIQVDVDALGVDLLSIAGHKVYAPKGVGALYVRSGTALSPLLLGAGQEGGMRPGTENVAQIVGLGAACLLAKDRLGGEEKRLRGLTDELWRLLSQQVTGLIRHSPKSGGLPNTLMVSFPSVSGRELLTQADGVAASTGSACHAGLDVPSATLLSMRVPPSVAQGAVRLSLGRSTTSREISKAAEIIVSAYRSLHEN